jgi:hypothetical protein
MFNMQRFLRLANAHWAEYRKAYAWFIAIGIMVQFVLMLIIFSDWNDRPVLRTDMQGSIYYAGLFLTAPIFAARYFQLMSKPESALIILMRPASVFEKWLLAFIIVAVLYPIIYTLAFYVCNLPAALLAKAQAHNYILLNPQVLDDCSGELNCISYNSPEKYDVFFIGTSFKNSLELIPVFLTMTALQAFAVLGSLYFKTMPFIKTLLIAFFVLLACIFVSVVFGGDPEGFFQAWRFVGVLKQPKDFMYLFTWLCVPSLLWLSCFLALKEREVA